MAADRIIQVALAKRPADRYPDAAAMAREVRSAWALIDTGETPQARAMTRLIVLPFRVLRPDPETDFLASSLPDAITGLAVGPRCARGPVHRGRAALRRREPRPQGHRDRGRGGRGRDRHPAARRRSDPGRHPDAGGPVRHAALLQHHPGRDHRPVPGPGRGEPTHRRVARPAAFRPRPPDPGAGSLEERQGLRPVPAGQPPGRRDLQSLAAHRGARSLPQLPGGGSGVRAGLGAARAGLSGAGQVRRAGPGGESLARGAGVPARAGDQPRSADRAQLLHLFRDRGAGPGARGGRAAAGAGRHRRGGPPPLRGPGGGVPLLRIAGGVARRRPPGPPDRSLDPDQRAVHLLGARATTSRRRCTTWRTSRRSGTARSGCWAGRTRRWPACGRR